MKKRLIPLLLTALISLLNSCDFFSDPDSPESGTDKSQMGEICLGFDKTDFELTTKAVMGLKDSTEFILKITKSDGSTVYNGKYGNCPDNISVSAGTYTITVMSMNFSSPAFESPLFGDEQYVVVNAGQKARVKFLCQQLNCGMKLTIGSNFRSAYSGYYLYILSNQGKLMYAFNETRAAYFQPGTLSVVLSDGTTSKTLFSRTLQERQMLSLKIDCSSSSSGSGGSSIGSGNCTGTFSIEIDTCRVWSSASINVDTGTGSGNSDSGGSQVGDAYSVAEAKLNIGDEDVWVYGYIVGGDLTSSSMRFETPFSSATNIAIAGRTSVSDKSSCMSVQLPTGKIRDALNLRDNPSNLGRKLFIKGDIVEAYYGIPGIKNITDFQLQ